VTSGLERPEYQLNTFLVLQLVTGQQELLKVQALPTLHHSGVRTYQVWFQAAT